MKRRRIKRAYEVSKRCHCPNKEACAHHWFCRVFANGKRQRIDLTATFPGEPVAVAAAKAKVLAQRGPVKPVSAKPTLGEVALKYPRSGYYLTGLRNLIGDDKPIDDVTTADIKRCAELWKQRPKAGVVAVRHLLQTARHLFNWAIREGYATRTPFKSPQGATLITVRGGKARTRRLEAGEGDRILAVADPFVTDFFTAMLETGCRPGELRTLQFSEVHDDHFVILASKAKDKDERKIPIMPDLRTILDRRRKGPDGNNLEDSAYVFGSETGELFSKERVCEKWRRVCKAANIENLHLHDLRGEFGSTMLEAGVPMHEVRDALGHANISITSTYLRTRTNSLDTAYARRASHMKLVKNRKAANQ